MFLSHLSHYFQNATSRKDRIRTDGTNLEDNEDADDLRKNDYDNQEPDIMVILLIANFFVFSLILISFV